MTTPVAPGSDKTKGTKTKVVPQAPPPKTPVVKTGFFGSTTVMIDVFANEDRELARVKRKHAQILIQSLLIAGLAVGFVLAQPLFEPVYLYFAEVPEGKTIPLVALPMPNMTNHAVLSWASSSITEVMTIGFGDFDQKLLAQKWRFTPDGWDAFVRAFLSIKANETFKHNQLVLTTVPSDTPIIQSQGPNDRDLYQWVVEMPIIMTYATNNNVTRKEKGTVRLTIVRSHDSPTGIAIESWQL